MNIAVYESTDAASLSRILNELPAGAKIISIYARAHSHWAWVQLPTPVEVTASDFTNESKTKKRKVK